MRERMKHPSASHVVCRLTIEASIRARASSAGNGAYIRAGAEISDQSSVDRRYLRLLRDRQRLGEMTRFIAVAIGTIRTRRPRARCCGRHIHEQHHNALTAHLRHHQCTSMAGAELLA